MIDRVESKCHKCGQPFHTWLSRGEIAPALCLGCWWLKTDQDVTEPTTVQESSAGRTKRLVDYAKKRKEL
jgi:hypothetical protein